MKAKILVIGMMFAGLSATTAWGDILFNTSGTTSGGSVSGSANFALSGGDLLITLTNSSTSVRAIAQVLDGLSFTLTGGSGLALVGVAAANNFEDSTGSTCQQVTTFVNQSHQTSRDVPRALVARLTLGPIVLRCWRLALVLFIPLVSSTLASPRRMDCLQMSTMIICSVRSRSLSATQRRRRASPQPRSTGGQPRRLRGPRAAASPPSWLRSQMVV